jgi:hypothetical protein
MKRPIAVSLTILTLAAGNALAAKPATLAPVIGQSPASAAAAPQPGEPLNGKVLETMNSGSYSYVFIERKDGSKIWVAVPETEIKVGSKLEFKPGAAMGNFESKSLKRTFNTIIFSEGVVGAPAGRAAGSGGQSSAMPRTTTAMDSKAAVGKATGANASTIENAYSNSSKLNQQMVVVRGKVVKVSSGIMGKNWVHIQDGTGSPEQGNYDLTCTTDDALPKLGAVVTVKGTLVKDRNFGAGYFYSVILENAKF